MKKLYFLMAALLVGGISQARELTFYFGNDVVEPNSTVVFNDIEENPAGGGMKEVVMAPPLYVSSDIYTKDLKITATCTSGQEIQLCAGGNCMTGPTVTKEGIKVQPDQKLALDLEYIAQMPVGETAPRVAVTVEAQDGTYEETKKSFTIVMNENGAGVDVIENDRCFMAVDGGIKYDFAVPASVELFTLSGVRVMARQLEGAGILSTEELASGIYLFTAKSSEGTLSGKLFVR